MVRTLRKNGFTVKKFPVAAIEPKGRLTNPIPRFFALMGFITENDLAKAPGGKIPALRDVILNFESKRKLCVIWELLKQMLWPWHNYTIKFATLRMILVI